MKLIRILVIVLALIVPVYADQCVQINYGSSQCTSHVHKYCKHKASKRKIKIVKAVRTHYISKTAPHKIHKACAKQGLTITQIQDPVEINQPKQVFINSTIINNQIPTVNKVEHIQQHVQHVQCEQPKQVNRSNFAIKTGFTGGSLKMTCENDSETIDLDNSFFAGAEYTLNRSQNTSFGIGCFCEFNKNYNAIPIYGFMKYQLSEVNLIGSLGYSLYMMKDKPDYVKIDNGSLYYAIGLEYPANSQLKLFSEYLSYSNKFVITFPCGEQSNLDMLYNKFAFGLKIEI